MMRLHLLLSLALLTALGTSFSPVFGQATAAEKNASTYPAFDVHADDHITIAAEPFDTEDKVKIFKVNYLKYGFMPIRVIVSNDGDRPISLNEARIHFISAHGDKIQAAEPDDVERRVNSKDKMGKNIPIGPIKLHTKPSVPNGKIEQDFNALEYAALAVEPHTTRAGFLFYDMDGLGSNPLHGAKLVLRTLRDADGKELFYFEIPFDKYLDAKH
jgi:hypothetical protein